MVNSLNHSIVQSGNSQPTDMINQQQSVRGNWAGGIVNYKNMQICAAEIYIRAVIIPDYRNIPNKNYS